MVVFTLYCATGHFAGVILATENTRWLYHVWHAETRRLLNVWYVSFVARIVGYINALSFANGKLNSHFVSEQW